MSTSDPTTPYEMDTGVIESIQDSISFMVQPLWITVIARVVMTIFLVICIIPHSIIIRRIGKSELYRTNNFYFILVHLSWGNLLLMIYSVYLTYVTDEYQADPNNYVFLVVHITTVQTHMQHALLFSIDKFVNSKKFCRTQITTNWTMHAFAILLMTIFLMHDIVSKYAFINGFIVISTIIFASYITRFVLHLVKGTDQENYAIRLAVSGICIVTNYGYVVWEMFENFSENNSSIILNCASVMVHSSGWFTLLLLNYYDANVDVRLKCKETCRQYKSKLLKCCRKRKQVAPVDEEQQEPNSRRNTTSSTDYLSGNIGNEAFVPDLVNGQPKNSDEFQSIGHPIDCLCNDCIFQNHISIHGPRDSKESNVSII